MFDSNDISLTVIIFFTVILSKTILKMLLMTIDETSAQLFLNFHQKKYFP